jgi:hypothetical protein
MMRFVRLAVIIALIATCSIGLHAQQVFMMTWEAFVLNAPSGVILQYSYPLGPVETWQPAKRVKSFHLGGQACPRNCVQIQTVKGAGTKFYMTDSHDFCKPSCTYLGTFSSGLNVQQNLDSEGSIFQTVTGSLTGTFTDALGRTFDDVPALFGFTTYPGRGNTGVPATGSLIVTLQEN